MFKLEYCVYKQKNVRKKGPKLRKLLIFRLTLPVNRFLLTTGSRTSAMQFLLLLLFCIQCCILSPKFACGPTAVKTSFFYSCFSFFCHILLVFPLKLETILAV